jgi:phenylacetaldehyde dehydrogenase
VIVLPDVDIERTAAAPPPRSSSIRARSASPARACYAHRDIFDKLLEGVAARPASGRSGPSLAPDTRMGPLVSTEQHER